MPALWQRSSPNVLEEVCSFSNKSNNDLLSGIVCQAENMPFLKSLIAIQNANVVVEKYMHGGAPDQAVDLKSATKSILSAVLRIAIRDGYIKRQVVPSDWVKQSTSVRSGMIGTYYSRWDKKYGYGYL